MNSNRYGFLFSLLVGIIFVGGGFVAGYLTSTLLVSSAVPPAEAVSAVPTPAPTQRFIHAPYSPTPTDEVYYNDENSPQPFYYGTHYIVCIINDDINLIESDGEEEKILKKSKINMNSFPDSDIQLLKNGITKGTLEGALEIWESFTE